MTVRLSAGRRAAPALLALGLAVGALTGCTGQPGAAAVVGGDQISIAELQAATADLSPYLQNVTQASVLTVLVVAPTFERAAVEEGVGVSTEQAVELLDEAARAAAAAGTTPARTTPFSDAAVEVARFTLIQTNLQALPDGADVSARITDQLAALDADVNPRYGQADFAAGTITPTSYPWLVAPPAAG